MKTILFVVPRFHTNLYFATRALVRAGYKVHVFARKAAKLEDYSVVTPVVFDGALDAVKIGKAFSDIDPDLVFLRRTKELSTLVGKIARKHQCHVVHYDLRPLNRKRNPFVFLRWKLRGLPSLRVTPVRGTGAEAPEASAHYLPWPVGVVAGDAKRDFSAGRPLRVLCVGKLRQVRKNQAVLIDAIREQINADKVMLTLAGSSGKMAKGTDDAYYERLRQEAANSKGRIQILEDVPYLQMEKLYQEHDVCVLPAHGEPLGIAPVEGMFYGCVPIVSDECGMAGYISEGVDGFVVSTKNLDQLGKPIEKLAGDRKLLAQMSAATRKTAESELGEAMFLDRIEKLFAMLESNTE